VTSTKPCRSTEPVIAGRKLDALPRLLREVLEKAKGLRQSANGRLAPLCAGSALLIDPVAALAFV
jgi:hypothetical protein